MKIALQITILLFFLTSSCFHKIRTGTYSEPGRDYGFRFTIIDDSTFNYQGRYRGNPDSIYIDMALGSYYRLKDTLFLSYKNPYTILLPDSTLVNQEGLYKPAKLLKKRNKLYYCSSDNKWYSNMDLKREKSPRSKSPL
jgi:hypothetical protein